MPCARIRPACGVHVGKEDCVAGPAAERDTQIREIGVAAFEPLVQIDEKGEVSLVRVVSERVAMQLVLLAWRVAQNFESVRLAHR